MRIVQVSVGSVKMPPKEGSAPLQVIFNTSKHLARMNHQVVILDRKYSKDDSDVDHVEGVEIARLKVMQVPLVKAPGFIRFILAELNAVLFALAVNSYLRKNRANIDVIHLHLTSIGLIVSLLNRSLREKMIYTCHLGQWGQAKERLHIFERIQLFLDPYVMKRVSKVIALNDSAKACFISAGKVEPEKITVVPNGVDTYFFSPDEEAGETARKKYRLEGKSTVLFVGRLARLKGVEYLLKAADMVVNGSGCRDTSFVLVGSPTFDATEKPISMEQVLSYIRQHGLEKHFVLTGSLPLEEVKKLYAAADLFVMPSLAETGPLVTLEAMASGKPVIGTKVGAMPNQIRDGWNGFLIDPRDEQQLADKIKYLIDNPDERQQMGKNSRKYAEEEFDWGNIAERLSQVYQGRQ